MDAIRDSDQIAPQYHIGGRQRVKGGGEKMCDSDQISPQREENGNSGIVKEKGREDCCDLFF